MSAWRPEQYARELALGLDLSGEDAGYFAAARVRYVAEHCHALGWSPRRIVEFGCGLGGNLGHLSRAFPAARVLGLDPSEAMLSAARERMQGIDVELMSDERYADRHGEDLVFVNGVFHHIAPAERGFALRRLHGFLAPQGLLALFDNNPLNPGAMWVMKRIPFDRDAKPVLARTLARLAREAGFCEIVQRTHFYFPRALAALRVLEPQLSRLPLGAQYVLYARPRSAF